MLRQFGLMLCAALACFHWKAARGAEIRLFDNTCVIAMVEGVSGARDALRVTTLSGEMRTIPLSDIISIDFRGREQRMLLSGTQEIRFINDDRLRGSIKANSADKLLVETFSLGALQIETAYLKGFVSLPQMGRAGREAEEALETRRWSNPYLDVLLEQRGSKQEGALRSVTKDGFNFDMEDMPQTVTFKTLMVAGLRLADASRQKEPPFPADVILRVKTADGSLLSGWIDKIEMGRWNLRPVWNKDASLPLIEKEMVSIQVLNARRLYLSQLTPIKVNETADLAPAQPYQMDKSCQGDALTFAGRGDAYPWGIGVHANSELTFALNKEFKTFQSIIGIDGHSAAGSAVFSVIGDGKVLYTSQLLRASDGAKEISVPIESVNELILKVSDGGDSDFGDMADWALAQLLR